MDGEQLAGSARAVQRPARLLELYPLDPVGRQDRDPLALHRTSGRLGLRCPTRCGQLVAVDRRRVRHASTRRGDPWDPFWVAPLPQSRSPQADWSRIGPDDRDQRNRLERAANPVWERAAIGEVNADRIHQFLRQRR